MPDIPAALVFCGALVRPGMNLHLDPAWSIR